MAVSAIFDRVLETSTTTGTGTLTLAGAVTGYQSWAVVGDGNQSPSVATWAVDGNGNPSGAWEIAALPTYTAAGTTLSRGTFLASSTGSVISWAAGTKYVGQVALPALFANQMLLASKGAIQGLNLAYNSATVLRVLAGVCSINNKVLALAQTDYTSGSTMKNLANGTVTLAANSSYFVYAKDNAGTLEGRIQISNGSGDGNDPLFTASSDYWESVNGPSERRIGKFWTDGSGNIIPFSTTMAGRVRSYHTNSSTAVVLVSSGSSATFASITTTPYYRSDETFLLLEAYIQANTNPAYVGLSIDGGTATFAEGYIFVNLASVIGGWGLGRFKVPNTQSLKYNVAAGGSSALVNLSAVGLEMFV